MRGPGSSLYLTAKIAASGLDSGRGILDADVEAAPLADVGSLDGEHVLLAELVEQLGAHVHRVRRPFEPEGGAYGGKGPLHSGHHHGHGGHHHHHDHDHAHDHQQDGDRPQRRDVKLTVVHGTFRPDKRDT